MSKTDQYNMLFNNLPDGAARCRMHLNPGNPVDFTFIEVNPQFEKVTGLKDVKGKRATEVMPGVKNHYPELFENYLNVVRTGMTANFKIFIQSLNRWLRITAISLDPPEFLIIYENITDRIKTDSEIEMLVEDLQKAQIFANMGSWKWDIENNKVEWSDGMYRIFGIDRSAFEGDLTKIINESIHPDDINRVNESNLKVKKNNQVEKIEYRIIRQSDKSIRTILAEGKELLLDVNKQPRLLSGYVTDITEIKNAEFEKNTTIEFLKIINNSQNLYSMIKKITEFIQKSTDCEAVGIRLKEGEDYPYYETRGFDDDFVIAENNLCRRDTNGDVIRDMDFNPILECMCGNVICGRNDSTKDFFSDNGSFFSNSTTRLLATTTVADRQSRTRNRCNGEGYESVALIPLVSDHERLGLLQMNDKRDNMFTLELIKMWERLSGYLAIAICKFKVEELLSQKLKEREVLLSEIHHRVKNNLQIIISLLNLQRDRSRNEDFHNIINDSCSRIFSMSLVHDRLYNSEDFEHISVKQYIRSLLGYLDRELFINENKIDLKVNVFGEELSIEIMVPLGLVINELVTNSAKHAFNSTLNPEIEVILERLDKKHVKFCYRDNGIGFDVEQNTKAHSIGLTLIHNLTEQIGDPGIFTNSIGVEFISIINTEKAVERNYLKSM